MNMYRMPFLEIIGLTSINMIFSVVFAYLQYERKDNFTWALGVLHGLMDNSVLFIILL